MSFQKITANNKADNFNQEQRLKCLMKLLDEVWLYEIRPLFCQLFFVLEMSSALLSAAYVQVHKPMNAVVFMSLGSLYCTLYAPRSVTAPKRGVYSGVIGFASIIKSSLKRVWIYAADVQSRGHYQIKQ